MSRPQHSTRPAVGTFDPVISSKSVVLPDPFGPITPTIAGAATVNSASSENVGVRRSTPRAYTLRRPSTARSGAAIADLDPEQPRPERRVVGERRGRSRVDDRAAIHDVAAVRHRER